MEIKRISVLGAGTMGSGIAQAAAAAGFEVALFDVDGTMLAKAVEKLGGNLEKHFVAKGKLTSGQAQAIMNRVATFESLKSAAGNADFVIEAVPEILKLKKEIFAELDRICPPHTILATNTSALSVTAIAGATRRIDRCIGMHFFNPAMVMKLVEVVLPIGVSQEAADAAILVCTRMGKTAVKAKDIPGFIVNRLLKYLYQEAAQMVLEGAATAEEIDLAMKLGAGHPMGPCELADFGGLDLIVQGGDEVYRYTQKESDKVNLLYRKMVEAGRFGVKNGKGFYDYATDGTKTPFKVF